LNGSREAEKQLYEKYKIIVHDYIKSKYYRHTDIEDEVSEVLIKVFIGLKSFDINKTKFKTWVINIIRNYMIDRWRSSNTSITTTNAAEYYKTVSSSDGEYSSMDEYTISGDPQSDFDSALLSITSDLTPFEFGLIKMKADGYKYSEIGAKYNMTSTTVSNKINYIKTKLKKELC